MHINKPDIDKERRPFNLAKCSCTLQLEPLTIWLIDTTMTLTFAVHLISALYVSFRSKSRFWFVTGNLPTGIYFP